MGLSSTPDHGRFVGDLLQYETDRYGKGEDLAREYQNLLDRG